MILPRFALLTLTACTLIATACTGVRPRQELDLSRPIRISPADSRAAEAAVASAPGGGAYVLYVEHHGEDGADIYFQTIDKQGNLTGERTRVNPDMNSAKAWRGDPPTIATASQGSIFVGWTRRYSDPVAKGNDLVLSVSADGGRTFAPPVKVNDDGNPAAHGMHSLAVDPNGRIIMAWLDERNVQKPPHQMNMTGGEMHHDEKEPNSEVFVAVSDDGGKTFSPNQRIAQEACPCCKTNLLAAADGNVYVAWRQVLEGDHRHIAVANSTDRGRTFSTASIVSNDNWQLYACPVSGPVLASTEKDEVEVLWFTEGSAGPPGLYFTHSHDGGKTFDERQIVSDVARSGTPAFAADTAVFNKKDGMSLLRLSDHARRLAEGTIDSAADPVAARVGDGIAVAFTRVENGASSVWVDVVGR